MSRGRRHDRTGRIRRARAKRNPATLLTIGGVAEILKERQFMALESTASGYLDYRKRRAAQASPGSWYEKSGQPAPITAMDVIQNPSDRRMIEV